MHLVPARPLNWALQKILVFRFFDPGPGVRRPLGSSPVLSVGLPGASGGLPGPKTNQSKKHRNLKELTEQWSFPRMPRTLMHLVPGHHESGHFMLRSIASGHERIIV